MTLPTSTPYQAVQSWLVQQTVWIPEKEKRTVGKGKLTITNRDTEGYCFKVEFNKSECSWNFLGIDDDKNI